MRRTRKKKEDDLRYTITSASPECSQLLCVVLLRGGRLPKEMVAEFSGEEMEGREEGRAGQREGGSKEGRVACMCVCV